MRGQAGADGRRIHKGSGFDIPTAKSVKPLLTFVNAMLQGDIARPVLTGR
jgi:hypothetical protein